MKIYSKEHLSSGERVLLVGKISKATLLPSVVFTIIIGLVGGFICSKLEENGSLILLILALLLALFWIPKIVHISNTEICITNQKVMGRTGLFETSDYAFPLDKITCVATHIPFSGKLFKYGTIVIKTPSGGVRFPYIADPALFKDQVFEQINNYKFGVDSDSGFSGSPISQSNGSSYGIPYSSYGVVVGVSNAGLGYCQLCGKTNTSTANVTLKDGIQTRNEIVCKECYDKLRMNK